MPTVLMLTRDERRREELILSLTGAGFTTATMADAGRLAALGVEDTPDILILDIPSLSPEEASDALASCRSMRLPSLALLSETSLSSYDPGQGGDDFILAPPSRDELVARVGQLLWRLRGRQSLEVIQVGDLLIDQGKYEVLLDGHKVLLTFKEYELLRLLASSPGRVFTREELLSRVWGYDYFGGTRTVDVHIRRLRSKVEDAHHTFIETVWNVGYRFKEPVETS